ncbi:MAG: response regulator [Minicystis sp.]
MLDDMVETGVTTATRGGRIRSAAMISTRLRLSDSPSYSRQFAGRRKAMITGGDRRALVVHGAPSVSSEIAGMFRVLGFATDTAIDGRAAIRLMAENRPDIVCVSLSLPRESGYDLCEIIRGNPSLARVEIIVLSDRHSPDIVAHAEEAGAGAFLAWPFKVDVLSACVADLLEYQHRSHADEIVDPLRDSLAAE